MPEPAATPSEARRWRSAIDAGLRAADGQSLNLANIVSGRSGELMGRGIGQSIEFMDFREYEPGDDIRRIDWQVYARSDRVMIRRHREEISPSVEIVLDGSRSMDLPGSAKADAALAVAAALCAASVRTGLTTRFHGVRSTSPRSVSVRDPRDIAWDDFDGTATLADASPALRASRATQGMRIIVSDLLFPADFTRLLRDFARGAHALVVVQVLAKTDVEPGSRGSLLLRDRETGQTLQVDLTPDIASRYRLRFEAHASVLRDAARSCGARLIEVVADEPFDGSAAVRTLTTSGLLRSTR